MDNLPAPPKGKDPMKMVFTSAKRYASEFFFTLTHTEKRKKNLLYADRKFYLFYSCFSFSPIFANFSLFFAYNCMRQLDTGLRNIIDKLAEFVARNGPEFETITKAKQQSNPRFSFLFGGEFYQYYQWRVSAEQGRMLGFIYNTF